MRVLDSIAIGLILWQIFDNQVIPVVVPALWFLIYAFLNLGNHHSQMHTYYKAVERSFKRSWMDIVTQVVVMATIILVFWVFFVGVDKIFLFVSLQFFLLLGPLQRTVFKLVGMRVVSKTPSN